MDAILIFVGAMFFVASLGLVRFFNSLRADD